MGPRAAQELIARMERITGVRAHRFLRRGLFFSHKWGGGPACVWGSLYCAVWGSLCCVVWVRYVVSCRVRSGYRFGARTRVPITRCGWFVGVGCVVCSRAICWMRPLLQQLFAGLTCVTSLYFFIYLVFGIWYLVFCTLYLAIGMS